MMRFVDTKNKKDKQKCPQCGDIVSMIYICPQCGESGCHNCIPGIVITKKIVYKKYYSNDNVIHREPLIYPCKRCKERNRAEERNINRKELDFSEESFP